MQTIDLTPTWTAILPALIAVLRDGNEEGKALAARELQRMAQAADRWNTNAPKLVNALKAILADENSRITPERYHNANDAILNAGGEV